MSELKKGRKGDIQNHCVPIPLSSSSSLLFFHRAHNDIHFFSIQPVNCQHPIARTLSPLTHIHTTNSNAKYQHNQRDKKVQQDPFLSPNPISVVQFSIQSKSNVIQSIRSSSRAYLSNSSNSLFFLFLSTTRPHIFILLRSLCFVPSHFLLLFPPHLTSSFSFLRPSFNPRFPSLSPFDATHFHFPSCHNQHNPPFLAPLS